MHWIEIAVTFVAAFVALVLVVRAKRPPDVAELGSLSNQWIAEHHSL
jgi:hypothetical protein